MFKSLFIRGPLRTVLFWSPSIILPLQYIDVCYITGQSMQPTLNPDTSPTRDVAFFEGFSTRLQRKYSRGDIVYLISPADPTKKLVKRIVGTEGDLVQTLPPYPESLVKVPPHHVWVEGDEWFHSDGSNHFGPVHVTLIRSKLLGLVWPLNRFGPVPPPTLDTEGPSYEKAMITIQQQARITPRSL